jgi:hypothetical protein
MNRVCGSGAAMMVCDEGANDQRGEVGGDEDQAEQCLLMSAVMIHEQHHREIVDGGRSLCTEATHLVKQGPVYSRSTSWWRYRVAVVNVRVIIV